MNLSPAAGCLTWGRYSSSDGFGGHGVCACACKIVHLFRKYPVNRKGCCFCSLTRTSLDLVRPRREEGRRAQPQRVLAPYRENKGE